MFFFLLLLSLTLLTLNEVKTFSTVKSIFILRVEKCSFSENV